MGRMGKVAVHKVRTWRGWEKLLFIRYEHGEGVKVAVRKVQTWVRMGKVAVHKVQRWEDGESCCS